MVIGFHRPDEEYGFLSNWYMTAFTINEISFSSMEQYMMYQKAICFRDTATAEQIMKASNVAEIKRLGRSVVGYDDHIWNGMRQIVVYEGLKAKFSQNGELKQKLLDTKNAILAECAVNDHIWGIGLSIKDPSRDDITKWKGQNLLGYALMMVRGKILN